MKTSDLLILGGIGIAAYFLLKYFSGSAADFSFGGGGGGNDGGGGAGSAQTIITRRDYTGKTQVTPIVQQAPNVITRGSITQIGQPAYSGRTQAYIRTDVSKPSQVQFMKDPIGSLRSMIGFQVGGYKAPPATILPPKRTSGVLVPLIRR